MFQPSFKTVVEDSSRNKFFLYYSGTSVCCKEVSKDGITRDTIIASQVNENFLANIDLQDKLYVVCQNKEKGVYLFQYINGDWKLEHILNIQGMENIIVLSLFALNGALHILYAKQMAIANFYNIYHLYKPNSPDAYHLNTTWRKNSVCEIYTENLITSFDAIITKEGTIHLVSEWYDGSNYLINYCFFDSSDYEWKKKNVATLSKKDIELSILYEESYLYLICYTYEDDTSIIFSYVKKDASDKDFEFYSMDKIKTESRVSPSYHIEGSILYTSWITENKFYQYSLNKEQRNWIKRLSGTIPSNESIKYIEYIRNRKGKYWIIKKTYFTIDSKYNINLPYFKENSKDEKDIGVINENAVVRNADGDLIRYIPYLIDEIKTLSQIVKALSDRIDLLENKKPINNNIKPANTNSNYNNQPRPDNKNTPKLRQSNFRDQFMKSNKLLSRPEAAAIFVGAANIPDPDELSKKEGIDFVENHNPDPKPVNTKPVKNESAEESLPSKIDTDPNIAKENNIFKKIGDFFK